MSELQIDDDPDPQPSRREYPINWETGLAFDDHDLVAELAEREGVYRLTVYADRVIESELGEGETTKRRLVTDDAQLYRTSTPSGAKLYAFYDTLEDSRRCRAWKSGDSGVSWCENELRYEPANEVLARLESVFPVSMNDEAEYSIDKRPRNISMRLKRQLAAVIMRLGG